MDENKPETKSWLTLRIETLDAVYQKYGKDGLKDYPLADVSLLLSAKELEFRDAPKGQQSETQREHNRHLELEIKDLTSLINAQLGAASLSAFRSQRYQSAPQQYKPKDKGYDIDR